MTDLFHKYRHWAPMLFFLLFCNPHSSYSQQSATGSLWESANKLYAGRQYDSARSLYLQLLEQDPGNVNVWYNLGNTAYRLNDIPHAVLYYQKVLRAQPDHTAARQNLILAQSRISGITTNTAPLFFIQWWNNMTAAGTTNTWAGLALVFFALSILALYLGKTGRLKYSGRYLSTAITCFILTTGCAFYSYQQLIRYDKSVVIQDHAMLLEAPKTAAKVLGTVPAGSTVSISTKQPGFVKVSLSNGRSGWMDASVLEDI